MAGTVVVSLDFELGWGHRQSRPAYVNRIRDQEHEIESRFETLVDTFERHNIAATWGVVGKLLEDSDDALYSNPSLLTKVVESEPDHEIGLHSYAHTPFDELSPAEARDDLTAGKAILSEYGVKPQSFIFPQNRVDHLDLLSEFGITCYRDGVGTDRLLPGPATKLIPPTVKPTKDETGVAAFPGSMFLAESHLPPQLLRWKAKIGLHPQKLRWKAKIGLQLAIRRNGIVHLWLHPHNVIVHPEVLSVVDHVFSYINEKRSEGLLVNETMNSVINSHTLS